MIVQNPPAGFGATVARRPSSLGAGDVYGSYPTGVPTTAMDGTVGGARVETAITDVQGAAPGSGSFLTSPVALLIVFVVALGVLSYVED